MDVGVNKVVGIDVMERNSGGGKGEMDAAPKRQAIGHNRQAGRHQNPYRGHLNTDDARRTRQTDRQAGRLTDRRATKTRVSSRVRGRQTTRSMQSTEMQNCTR